MNRRLVYAVAAPALAAITVLGMASGAHAKETVSWAQDPKGMLRLCLASGGTGNSHSDGSTLCYGKNGINSYCAPATASQPLNCHAFDPTARGEVTTTAPPSGKGDHIIDRAERAAETGRGTPRIHGAESQDVP